MLLKYFRTLFDLCFYIVRGVFFFGWKNMDFAVPTDNFTNILILITY